VLRAPYENRVGRVVALSQLPHRLPSGVRAYGADVEIELEGRAFVPLENLEILR
jgi:hypothetical protein